MSVSKLKQQVARSEYDARFAGADRNRVASIEYCVAHLFTHLDRGSKAWVTVKISFPEPFAWFLPFHFSLAVAIDDATGHGRSGAKKYRKRSRKKVSGRRFKTRSVGLVEAETFFCLASSFFVQSIGRRHVCISRSHSFTVLLLRKGRPGGCSSRRR